MWSWTALRICLSDSFWMLHCQSWKYTENSSDKQQNLRAGDCWASPAGSTQKQLNWNSPCLTFFVWYFVVLQRSFPKVGVAVGPKQPAICSGGGGRVSSEKWPRTCPAYPRADTVSCESRVQRPRLKPFGPAESQVGRSWNLSWLNLRLLPAGDGHGKGKRSIG